ncbi:MAG TPA: four-carbon acid sugar kinase family protein [Microlunatus sp.]
MKTIVLDDDPTGTQSATGVKVLLDSDADLLTAALTDADSVYVQTNSRALHEPAAIDLVRRIRNDGEEAGRRLGDTVRFVLRGDSTLRGHVFAETEQFLDGDAVMIFVPAFPDGGRTTRDGVHYVRIGDRELPADRTEYAEDPVFPFSTGNLADYVREKSERTPVPVELSAVRDDQLAAIMIKAEPGSVILPDVVDQHDVEAIARAIDEAEAQGRTVVIRSAAPLAAALAGVTSQGLLDRPLVDQPVPTLLVCGSHTAGATAQLEPVIKTWGAAAVVDTDQALDEPVAAGHAVAEIAARQLEQQSLAIIASDRVRRTTDSTLDHGERVMAALTTAVDDLADRVGVVIAKGGITSAEVARTGLGARSALVLGQVLTGVSVWQLKTSNGRRVLYVVVPGNVGGPSTLTDVLAALGLGDR